MLKHFLWAVLCSLSLFSNSWGQSKPNQAIFAPIDWPKADDLRTGGGAPGVGYWQNAASYTIRTAIDPTQNLITGSETITYTNNSPDALPFLWVQLDQNLFKPNAPGQVKQGEDSRWRGAFGDGGFNLSKVALRYNGKAVTPKYVINSTRMRIDLPEALAAKGGSIQIELDWSFKIPQYGADRMGRFDAEQGAVYQLAQWYPRMYVYDATDGWNNMEYLGQGEFYLDYGNYDVEISAPAEMVVVATGTLQNPTEVLTDTQVQRYNQAKKSAQTVVIIRPEEVGKPESRPRTKPTLTWKFKAENVRDFSWAASKSFIWDAAAWENVLLASAYPKEGLGDKENPGWEESTQMLRHSVQIYSSMWLPYPYPTMTNVAGVVGGMEYPMIIFCDVHSRGADLFGVTDHEYGHSWFPMVVGSDERRYAWMDEGFNTFINFYADNAYYKKNAAEVWTQNAEQMGFYAMMGLWDQPIMTHPDLIRANGLGLLAYVKPGYGLVMLREYILGPELFDAAFRTYIERWKFKHPQPQDFFRTMEEVSGEDLAWFWRGWFYGTDLYDAAIKGASQNGSSLTIQLANKKGLVMPQVLELKMKDGKTERLKLPVQIWHTGNDVSTQVFVKGQVVRITLDPDKILPDGNRNNDVWKASSK